MKTAESRTGYAEVNGTSFYYEIAGFGDPVVLVHAGIADRRMWDGQFRAFAQHYRVIRYDMRGYGNSPPGESGFSSAQDLHAILGAIGIDHATLIGSSQGGTTTLDLALEHPAVAKALVLVSTTPSGYEFKGEPPQKLLEFIGAYQLQEVERASELATQIWFDGPHRAQNQVSPELRDRVRYMFRDNIAISAMDAADEAVPERPAAGRLSEVRVPTLIVVGDRDDPSILRAGEEMASGIAGAQLVVIPGAAHLANMEKPAEFNRAVLDFLGRPS